MPRMPVGVAAREMAVRSRTGIHVRYSDVVRNYGEELGHGIAREGHNALDWIAGFIESERIGCDFRRSGRFYGVHSARTYER